ncbi:MAG: helix-turn-helix domain-containing protein [Chloroflexi bacterium]|nr:helix-turn-helix domain-containing protein [Chloroflexota bacterium]
MGSELVEIMTIKQVAHYLKLDTTTIYRLAQTKRIPAAKVGGVWRFRKDLIDGWLKSQAEENQISPLEVNKLIEKEN